MVNFTFTKMKESFKQWQFEKLPFHIEIMALENQFRIAEHHSPQSLQFFLETASTDYPEEFKTFKNYHKGLFKKFLNDNQFDSESKNYALKLALMLEFKFHLDTTKEPYTFIGIHIENKFKNPMDYYINSTNSFMSNIDDSNKKNIFQAILDFKAYSPLQLPLCIQKTSSPLIANMLKVQLEKDTLFDLAKNSVDDRIPVRNIPLKKML